MFREANVEMKANDAPPPAGVAEIVFCIFDEKHHVKHFYKSGHDDMPERERFNLLSDPYRAFESRLLTEAVSAHLPVSLSFSLGDGLSKYLHVLPYERKGRKWRFACLQITLKRSDPEKAAFACVSALAEERVCLLLADSGKRIQSASSVVPDAFGYTNEQLQEMNLSDLFKGADLGMISSGAPDTNETILNCVFHCMDGSKRDVEVKKYSATDDCMLYVICDVTRPQFNEEITAVSTRERRRIGQDLHDSIGQLLTGISLLSRSLSNSLKRAGNSGCEDAAQISELADDANNQIRQISRGLMPSDIVRRGLYASLRNLAQITTKSCGLVCETVIDEAVEFSDGAVETHLFRISQEAVNNAVRHSGGDRIDIVISEVDGQPQLEIIDNGCWRNIMENSGGIGMKTMQYRATVINGDLNIDQVEGGGTRVVCRLDVDEFLETKDA